MANLLHILLPCFHVLPRLSLCYAMYLRRSARSYHDMILSMEVVPDWEHDAPLSMQRQRYLHLYHTRPRYNGESNSKSCNMAAVWQAHHVSLVVLLRSKTIRTLSLNTRTCLQRPCQCHADASVSAPMSMLYTSSLCFSGKCNFHENCASMRRLACEPLLLPARTDTDTDTDMVE